jgi:starch synthase
MGIFDYDTFTGLGLPPWMWGEQALEFYGQCSFIKGGLVFADYVTTVSPTYAREICESPGGMGLEGLLRQRGDRVVGILNGIDVSTWDPGGDAHLAQNYSAATLDAKAQNRVALQREMGLQVRDDRPLLGFVGRLVEQKGLELMLPVLEQVLDSPCQLVLLGSGQEEYEEALMRFVRAREGEAALALGYNEGLAHRIEAGADIFLMPSLFEPCGLNQMYSLRYGTLPVVRRVGGLADTVVDADEMHLESGSATGFVFGDPEPGEFLGAVRRAVALWSDPETWRALQRTAMDQDFSWRRSAAQYIELYRSAAAGQRG